MIFCKSSMKGISEEKSKLKKTLNLFGSAKFLGGNWLDCSYTWYKFPRENFIDIEFAEWSKTNTSIPLKKPSGHSVFFFRSFGSFIKWYFHVFAVYT